VVTCLRSDNKTGWQPDDWNDPVDWALMDRALPILTSRHDNCVPSRYCLVDAITRVLEEDDDADM
jgi:hypothetical protein